MISNRQEIAAGDRHRDSWLLYLIPLLLLILYRLLLAPYISDDAYISLRVASNLAQGYGFAFNPGDPVYVTTSPLWVMLLAGVQFITGDVILAARILGILFEAGSLLLLVRVGKEVTKSSVIGMIAALLLCVNPVFLITSGSGMEIALYLCMILLSVLFLLQGRYAPGLAFAALSVWVRSDGILILAGAILWVLYEMWSRRRQKTPSQFRPGSKQILISVILPLLILGGYALFGLLVFDTPIPTSVQRKGMTSPTLLSGEWFNGAWRTGREFLKVLIGKSGYWITALSPLLLALPFLAIGSWKMMASRNRKILPLFFMTLLYIAGFVGSGSEYARHFPWYFVPVLPLAALLTGVGIRWFGSFISGLIPSLKRAALPVAISLIILWGFFNWYAIEKSTEILARSEVGPDERERLYGAAATWAGRWLDDGAVVAGNEIGALGFFLPHTISMLDMYGILRKPEDLERSWIKLVREVQPEAVLVRELFDNREEIEREMPGAYIWHRFRTLDIGLRSDLTSKGTTRLDELPRIYDSIDMFEEPMLNKR